MSKLTQYARHLAVVAIATLAAQCGWAVDVISINFGSGQTNASMSDQEGNDGSLLKEVPAASWNDISGNSATDEAVAHRYNGESTIDLTDVTVSFSGRGGNWYPHAAQRSTASRFLNGYIDDGANSQVSITVKNVPYSEYGVIIYYNGDNSGHRFKPVEVNGTRYTFVNGQAQAVASDAKSPIWGLPEQTTVAYGKNAIRITGLTATDLTILPGIYETVSGSQCRGTIAAVQIFDPSTVDEVVIDKDDVFTASAAEALDEADVYNLTIPADGMFTIDADMTRTYNIISTGMVTLKGANMTAANIAKLTNMTTGYIYRIEGDLSAGTTLDFGAGTYSFKNAKVSAQYGADYKVLVKDGDTFHLADRSGQADGRTYLSLDVQGGNVTIGKADGNGSFWYGGSSATTYNQTGGTVTCTANGTGASGSGNGLLLGWSKAIASMNVSGGILDVSNSSLNFWDGTTTLNISGGTTKAKGVFRGAGSNHKVVLSGNGIFELGSIGWTTVGLTMNGGTFKAVDTTTMAGAITMGGNATIEVVAEKELKLTGSVTGEGVITKKGEGVLNVGTTRPTIDVQEGSVKIVATPTEIVAGKLTLTVPQDATPASDDKVAVYDSEGNEIEITDVSIEGTTVTIILKTLPSIVADTTISSLALDPAAAGLIVVEGGATEEESITVSFDAALPEGVTMEINGFVKFVAGEGIDIPYAKMTFGEGATLIFDSIVGYEIPAGAAVIAGTASGTITNAGALTIGTMTSGTITNSGTLTIKGDSTFKLSSTGTVNIAGGTSTISADQQGINGTINVAFGATYKCTTNDQIPWGGSTTTIVNVRGTLDMQNHRWTLGGADTINLYGGCTVLGQGDNDGIFDLYREGNVINVLAGEGEQASVTTVSIPAPVRARHTNGNIFIAQNMKLALAGGIKNADVSGATINMNGNGRLTGTIPLNGGFYLNLGTSVGTIDAKFVAERGDTALKLGQGSPSVQMTTSDSMDEPFLKINSGATLQLYVKDFSSWNQTVTQYGWIKNEGTLNIHENSGSRYFRGHLVMKPGTTTTIYGTSQNFIVYGGNSDPTKAQIVVPASEEASTATLAGEGTIQLNVSGSGGTNGSAWDIGANSTLNVTAKVIGGEAIVKYGEGTLKLSNADSTYSGAVTLKGGVIKSVKTLSVTADKQNYALSTATETIDEVEYNVYSLVRTVPGEVTATSFSFNKFKIGDEVVTLIDGDTIVVPTDCDGDQWHPSNLGTLAGHTVVINKSMNWKTTVGTMVIGEGAKAYMYTNEGSAIASGANISGDGSLCLTQPDIPVNGPATITAAITFGDNNDGNGTFKLMNEDATLTCDELSEGKVVSGVGGKVPAYADGKYTLVTATYKVKVPTVANATVTADGYMADEDGYITVEHGASVTFTVTPNEGYNIGSTTTITLESVTAAVETVDVSSIEITEAVPPAPTATVEAITVEGVEGAHSFTANEMTEKQAAYYGDWNADFIVTFSRDMAEGEVTLTGQSDHHSEEWVDLDIGAPKAGVGIPLIASVLDQTGWTGVQVTYAFVYETVGTFNCGVKNNLAVGAENATMTVQLVISNGAKSIPIGEAITHELIAPTGPTSWTEVTEETKVTDIVSSETAAALAGSTVTAKEIADWATAKGVDFTSDITIPVNALIFNVAPSAAPTVETEAAAADAILKDLASKVDLTTLTTGELSADTLALLEKEYPMATIKLMDVTETVTGTTSDNTHLFKLSIELK